MIVCPSKKDETPITQREFPGEIAPTDPLAAELKIKLLKLGLVVHGFPATTKKRYYIQVAAVCPKPQPTLHPPDKTLND